MITREWCRRCTFETIHNDGKCRICALFDADKQDKEGSEVILEEIRENVHPEVADPDDQC